MNIAVNRNDAILWLILKGGGGFGRICSMKMIFTTLGNLADLRKCRGVSV